MSDPRLRNALACAREREHPYYAAAAYRLAQEVGDTAAMEEALQLGAANYVREGPVYARTEPPMHIPDSYLNQIVTGDARVLAEQIPDESVDVVMADPIYENIEDYAWLAETAARVLKPNGSLLAFCSIARLPETCVAMMPFLTWRWQFIEYRTNEVKHRHAPGGKCVYVPLLWFDKGKRRPSFVLDVRAVAVHTSSSNHEWSKPPLTVMYYLEAFSRPGDIVWDPFVGGGTTAAAAKMLGRNFIASEIDPERARRARERVEATQVPLPGLVVEQSALFEEPAP